MSKPGPFRLEPIHLSKVWAAPALPAPWDGLLHAPAGTGEVWLASDRHSITKVSGGQADGMGLDEVVARWPEWLLGPGRGTGFPLLLKVLSVGQWLSVQVHPDDAQAKALEGEPWGKSEAWSVLAAEDGAELVMGLKPGSDRRAVEDAIAAGTMTELLAKVPARAGDTFHLPAGTVHATGPGLTIFEIQQASDVTYRFYDWDRLGDDGKPRDLHLDKACQVMRATGPGAATPPRVLIEGAISLTVLVDDPHFALVKASLGLGTAYTPHFRGQRLRVLFVASGGGELVSAKGQFSPRELAPGQCWCLPFGLGQVEVRPLDGPLELLESVAL